jgi:hypothetical protein
VAFGSARWTFDELTDWADRIGAEYEWFLEIPAAMRMVGVDVVANRVELEISSAEQDAAAAVLAHFHPPEGLLRITSDGTGAALLPEGDVAGRVLAADGTTPKLDLQLGFAALDNTPGWCLEQVGYGIAENGLIIYRCKTGRRVVTVNARNDRFEYEIVAAAWIDVPADGEVAVELKLPADADRSSLTFHGWTASCGRAASLDCLGAVDRFTNVLGRSHDGVLATSGGRLSVELRPECPQVPVWAAAAECWQVSAEGGTGPICMVIARRADDLRYPPYVQVAGHTPGRPPPPEPWAAC